MALPSELPLALTCGDPAGVGPDVIAQWVHAHAGELNDICVIGPRRWLDGLGVPNRFAVGDSGFAATPGQASEAGARVAGEALEEAAMGCREGRYRAVVTGPVSKSWMQRVGWDFPGQTEFFAARWRGEATMAFAGGKLRVVLASWHIPLELVPGAIHRESLTRAVTNADFLCRRLGIDQPRIAVCGLNPHAGEDGLIGFEEKGHFNPILADLRADYPNLSDCLPGDTLFWRHLRGEFDVVVALYHDQGLAPLKTVDFDTAVNCTLGLPFIRTSPDHGTAFDLAGTGKASATSFNNAVDLARRLAYH
ncbi:MAG: 4-hydroxythreonine-4-phosphate dehydrogenase PdxA [Opitutales bacterium]